MQKGSKKTDIGIILSVFLLIIGLVFILTGTSLRHTDDVSNAVSHPEISRPEESRTEISDVSQGGETSADRAAIERFLSLSPLLDPDSAQTANADLAAYIVDCFGSEMLNIVCDAIEDGTYTKELWHDLTGMTLTVLDDIICGRLAPQSSAYDPYISLKGDSKTPGVIRLGFGGDFSFADNYYIAKAYDRRGQGLDGIFDPEVIELLHSHDLMTLNNEFVVSSRGKALSGKRFVFRAEPERLWIYEALGVELVTLGNNHVYDYGETAFYDTLDSLSAAGIKYIGAGRDIEEAQQAWYFIINGRKIGIVNGYRAYEGAVTYTPGAAEGKGGVNYCYDTEIMEGLIAEMRPKCDILIVYMHWGREDVYTIESIIREQGKAYIDAGADAIVGCHTHTAQGIEIYNGKPIAYSMGNFLFNYKTMNSCVVTLEIDNDGNLTCIYVPLLQTGTKLTMPDHDMQQRIRDLITSISVNIVVGKDNVVVPQS